MSSRARKSGKGENRGRAAGPQPARQWLWLGVLLAGVGLAGLLLPGTLRRALQRAGWSAVPSLPLVLQDQASVFSAYAGSESCRDCHREAYDLWAASNHALAERPLRADLDLAAFSPTRSFRHGSQRTTVRMNGTNCLVSSIGLTRSNETHQAVRVIGNDPLRQFLVAAPGGRLQILEASFDPRTNAWFNVYGAEDRQPGEWGHWTGRGMNWNSMCAGCHNTRVRKNYAEATDSYHTAMAEPTVGCEACHGPLKAHLNWQKRFGRSGKPDPTVPKLRRSLVMDYCGFCHARRVDLTGDFKPGDRFADHFGLVVVDETELYYPDGQVREEDYEFAAFLGSRMSTNALTCLDCHQPHSVKTILPGNWLCLRCHNGGYTNAPVINPVEHAHHKVYGWGPDGQPVSFDLTAYDPRNIKETGGECLNCHMPQTVYMQRHWRHDHGFTIPDPLLTRQFGIPNACTRCHPDKPVDWALEACVRWYGSKMERPTRQRAQWIARARAGDATVRVPLLAFFATNQSPYWEAVVARMLGPWVSETNVSTPLVRSLQHPDPLVRANAAHALEPLAERSAAPATEALRGLLQDPVRSVRLAAARALQNQLPSDLPAARELRHFQDLNGDQPGGQMQKGAFELARGHPDQALPHYEKAVAWDPNSAPIRHELAVVLSMLNRNREAVEQMQAACRLDPKEAEYQFKLGLAWNELGDMPKTTAALEEAVRLDPQHARAWYNLGLARNAQGQTEAALDALVRAESAESNDPRIPYARATILAQAGRLSEARAASRRALELRPDFAPAGELLRRLEAQP